MVSFECGQLLPGQGVLGNDAEFPYPTQQDEPAPKPFGTIWPWEPPPPPPPPGIPQLPTLKHGDPDPDPVPCQCFVGEEVSHEIVNEPGCQSETWTFKQTCDPEDSGEDSDAWADAQETAAGYDNQAVTGGIHGECESEEGAGDGCCTDSPGQSCCPNTVLFAWTGECGEPGPDPGDVECKCRVGEIVSDTDHVICDEGDPTNPGTRIAVFEIACVNTAAGDPGHSAAWDNISSDIQGGYDNYNIDPWIYGGDCPKGDIVGCCEGEDCCPGEVSPPGMITVWGWDDECEEPDVGGGDPAGENINLDTLVVTPSAPQKRQSVQRSPKPKLTGLPSKMMPNTWSLVSTTTKGNKSLNLNNNKILDYIITNSPTGLIDRRVSLGPTFSNINVPFIKNPKKSDLIFAKKIHPSIEELRSINNTFRDWNAGPLVNLTTDNIIRSLNSKFLTTLTRIRYFDGTPLTPDEIAKIVYNRLLDGSIATTSGTDFVPHKYNLIADQPPEALELLPSASKTVNLVAALNILENNKIPLDPAKNSGRQREISKLTRTLATDLNKALPITIGGEVKEFFIGDDNVVIQRTNIEVQDGDYVNITVGGTTYRVYLKSEIDHAYIVDPHYLRQVNKLLGGSGEKSLSVSAPYADDLEYNYSLNLSGESPWEKFYFATLVLSSVDSKASPTTPFITETEATYEIMDHTTASGLLAINELIKYRINYGVQSVHHDDIMLNYITSTGKFAVTREDFLNQNLRTDKTRPIFARQVPWYYIIFPTDREEYLTFGNKSQIESLERGNVRRTLRTIPMFNRFKQRKLTTPQWINVEFTYNNKQPDIFGNTSGTGDLQTRMAVLNPDKSIYTKGYKPGRGTEVEPRRKKHTLRLVKEIMTDLSNNYVLRKDGFKYALTTNDIIFRLSCTEFNSGVMLENFEYIWPKIEEGLIEDIKVFPATRTTVIQKLTNILARKSTFTVDNFPPIRGMNKGDNLNPMGGFILPPTTTTPNSSTVGGAASTAKAQTGRR